jgi:hypothetical protein
MEPRLAFTKEICCEHSFIRASLVCAAMVLPFVAYAQSLPEGLTCGLSYLGDGTIWENNSCNGVSTFNFDYAYFPCTGIDQYCTGCFCADACIFGTCDELGYYYYPRAAAGYTAVSDGDYGAASGDGFYHQRLTSGVTDPSLASSFVLPRGAACGFHHTRNSPGLTCMGYDPAKYFGLTQDGPAPGIPGCPPGWNPQKAFDMSSDYGYWTWCEYQDPNHLSDGQPSVQPLGIACGIAHNHSVLGTVGECMGYITNNSSNRAFCAAPLAASAWRDMGEPSNVGLGFCTVTSNPLPPPYNPPPPPTCDACGFHDCRHCPSGFYCDGLKGDPECGGCYCTRT